MAVVLTSLAASADERPRETPAKWATGRVGPYLFNVAGRGHYTLGERDGVAFTQGGGEVTLEGGGAVQITSFGSHIGFDFETAVGLTTTEVYADGTLRDQRDDDEREDPARAWLTARVGARLLVAPVTFGFDGFSVRLGLLAGVMLEGSGARSWTMPGALNIGAQLVIGTDGVFGLHASYLATPRQGEELLLIRHQASLDLGFGPLVIGGRWQLDEVTFTAPAAQLSAHSFFVTVGARFVDITKL